MSRSGDAAVDLPVASPADATGRPSARTFALAGTFVFILAFLTRLGFVLQVPGGIGGNVNDDSAAYYTGAAAIVHGRMPYADFVLLHPPLPDLLLTPFAAFGSVAGDHLGFMSAIVFSELLGAANAVLVMLVARRYGIGLLGTVLGGLFYAIWQGTAAGESVIALETFGNTAFLLALLALAGPATRRSAVLGGVALGAAITTKIVWVVPPILVVGWWLLHRETRARTPWLVGGIVGAAVVICGPFFVMAPRAMIRMIVVDQLNRPPAGGVAEHAALLSGVHNFWPASSMSTRAVLYVCLAVVVVAVAAFAWRFRPTRLIVLVAVAQLVVLVKSPSYFGHYAIYLGPALALVVAGAVASAAAAAPATAKRSLGYASRGVAVLLVAFVVVTTARRLTDTRSVAAPFPRTAVAKLFANTHCPTPDAPIALIETDTLSRTLADGCPNWVDVTGRVYDVDRPKPGAGYSRRHNKRWQTSLNRYLFSGDVVLLMRPKLGVGIRLQRRLDGYPLLLDRDGVRVYRIAGPR